MRFTGINVIIIMIKKNTPLGVDLLEYKATWFLVEDTPYLVSPSVGNNRM